MLERLDEMISEPEESESILVLASKLATYAAENARKRNQEAKAELGKKNLKKMQFLNNKIRTKNIRSKNSF